MDDPSGRAAGAAVKRRVLVAGLGNVLLSDLGIGPYCARCLIARYEFPPSVQVMDLGTPGLDLALYFSRTNTAILIDALQGPAPGTIETYSNEDVTESTRALRIGTRSPAFAASVLTARLAWGRPHEVKLIGMVGESFRYGAGLTPGVRARIPALLGRVLNELTKLDVNWRPRPGTEHIGLWSEEPHPLSRRAVLASRK
jgi:hydrogenase maturation protease